MFAANFAEKQWVKTADFVGIFWANFAGNRLILRWLTSVFNVFNRDNLTHSNTKALEKWANIVCGKSEGSAQKRPIQKDNCPRSFPFCGALILYISQESEDNCLQCGLWTFQINTMATFETEVYELLKLFDWGAGFDSQLWKLFFFFFFDPFVFCCCCFAKHNYFHSLTDLKYTGRLIAGSLSAFISKTQ